MLMFRRPELPLKQKNNRKKSSCLLFSLIDYLNEETKKKKQKQKLGKQRISRTAENQPMGVQVQNPDLTVRRTVSLLLGTPSWAKRLRAACENIHCSSLFAAGNVSRETPPAAKSEEKRLFSHSRPRDIRHKLHNRTPFYKETAANVIAESYSYSKMAAEEVSYVTLFVDSCFQLCHSFFVLSKVV